MCKVRTRSKLGLFLCLSLSLPLSVSLSFSFSSPLHLNLSHQMRQKHHSTLLSCVCNSRSKMDAFEAEDGAMLGSLLLEPIVMGAGGMVFVDPLFQRVLVQVPLSLFLPP